MGNLLIIFASRVSGHALQDQPQLQYCLWKSRKHLGKRYSYVAANGGLEGELFYAKSLLRLWKLAWTKIGSSFIRARRWIMSLCYFPVHETPEPPGESVAENREGRCGTARSAIPWVILQELIREEALPPYRLRLFSTPSGSEHISIGLEINKFICP